MDLDLLTTDELRHKAFSKAERAHDLGFFWDLVKHLRSARAIAAEDGSAGSITGTLAELVEMVRELGGHSLGDEEPLLRARFLDYLRAACLVGALRICIGTARDSSCAMKARASL